MFDCGSISLVFVSFLLCKLHLFTTLDFIFNFVQIYLCVQFCKSILVINFSFLLWSIWIFLSISLFMHLFVLLFDMMLVILFIIWAAIRIWIVFSGLIIEIDFVGIKVLSLLTNLRLLKHVIFIFFDWNNKRMNYQKDSSHNFYLWNSTISFISSNRLWVFVLFSLPSSISFRSIC